MPAARYRPVSGSSRATALGAPEGSIAGPGAGAAGSIGAGGPGKGSAGGSGAVVADSLRLSRHGDVRAQLCDLRRILAARATRDATDHPLRVIRRPRGQVLARREQRDVDVPAEESLCGLFIEPRRFRMPPGDHVGFGRGYVVAACRVRHRDRRRGADHRRDEDGDHHGGCLPAAKASVQHERMKPGYE